MRTRVLATCVALGCGLVGAVLGSGAGEVGVVGGVEAEMQRGWTPPAELHGFSVYAYRIEVPSGFALHVARHVFRDGDYVAERSGCWAQFAEFESEAEIYAGVFDPNAILGGGSPRRRFVATHADWWESFPGSIGAAVMPQLPETLEIGTSYTLSLSDVTYGKETGTPHLYRMAVFVKLLPLTAAEQKLSLASSVQPVVFHYDGRLWESHDPVAFALATAGD